METHHREKGDKESCYLYNKEHDMQGELRIATQNPDSVTDFFSFNHVREIQVTVACKAGLLDMSCSVLVLLVGKR